MEYKPSGPHRQHGDPWLNRERSRHWRRDAVTQWAALPEEEKLRSLRWQSDGKVWLVRNRSYRSVRSYFCHICRFEIESLCAAECERLRGASEERERRKVFERERRKPTIDEFPVKHGVRSFIVFDRQGYVADVAFHWRISKRWCIGSRPLAVQAMFVNGALRGKRYVDVSSFEHDEYIERSEKVDQDTILATQLAEWCAKDHQERLLAAEPAYVWRAGDAVWPDKSYGGHHFLTIVHTIWIDGSRHAHISAPWDLEGVLALAERDLGLRIVEVIPSAAKS
jgi:hypothetical protein